jgi:hypothetical protein
VDISPAGAGLELLDATPEETRGRRIVLAVEIKADVRYAQETADEGVRAGIQFVELTDTEWACITSLVGSRLIATG